MRLFPSQAQWTKYSWFKKFGIITSYVGFIALLVTLYQLFLTNPVVKNDLEPIAKSKELQVIKQQLSNISNQLNTNLNQIDTIGYPGFSINLMVIIKMNTENRKAFIFDRGNFINKERISLYLNEANELCYRIVDSYGEIHTIVIQQSDDGFILDKLIFITCEYGESFNTSFQRILINGKELERLNFSKNYHLSNLIKIEGSTLGADLNGENCSNLIAAMHSMAKGTFTRSQIVKFKNTTEHFINASNGELMKVGCGNYLRTGK